MGISGVFADLHEALEWLSSRRIHPGAEVVLQLQSGSHYYEESVVVSHADGARLRIVGDGSTSTLLSFDTGLAGLVAEDGAVIGGIDGLALVGDDGEEAGVLARRGAVVRLGGDLRVEGFAHGVHATLGAVIEAEAGVVTLSNFGAGFLADRGGVVRVEGSNALANESSGYIAADGGVLLADGGSSQGNASDGFLATDGGFLSARGGLAESNGQHGFVAQGADMVISDAEAMSHAGDTSFLATAARRCGSHRTPGPLRQTAPSAWQRADRPRGRREHHRGHHLPLAHGDGRLSPRGRGGVPGRHRCLQHHRAACRVRSHHLCAGDQLERPRIGRRHQPHQRSTGLRLAHHRRDVCRAMSRRQTRWR